MQRREALSTLAVTAAVTGAAGAADTLTMAAPSSSRKTSAAARKAVTPWIEARDGTRLHCMQWGSGSPILFLTSAGVNTQIWDYQMVAFADQGYRCIAFDRRGHGLSERPVGGYDYDTFGDDIHAVVKHLDLNNLTVVSHSMGGGEIARYLTRHGSTQVSRIVFVATTTPFLLQSADNPNGVPNSAFEALRAAWRQDFPKWVADNTDQFFGPATSLAMKQWGSALLMGCSVAVAIACHKATTATDFRADLSRISVPALVIHGDRDVSAPLALTGKPTADLIPGCQFKVYQEGPHGLMFTHMERLNADILRFIRET
jgi:non-heme chloroperoxidase